MAIIHSRVQAETSEQDRIDSFFNFCKERQNIYNKKESGEPAPWTDDKVLQKYKICNIYREQDFGTKYYLNSILSLYGDNAFIFFMTIAYRLCNRVYAFEQFRENLIEHDFQGAERIAKDYRKEHGVFFSNAYVTFGGLRKGEDKIEAYFRTCRWINENADAFVELLKYAETAENAYKIIQKIPFAGTFVGYQFFLDFLHTPILGRFKDDESFYIIGEGAAQGMDIIFGNHTKESFDRLWREQDNYNLEKPLSKHNCEFSLCEFRKWHNLSFNSGRGKLFK